MAQYRYVGNHAVELQVGDKRPWLAPGDFVELDSNELTDESKDLIANGVMFEIKAKDLGNQKGGKE